MKVEVSSDNVRRKPQLIILVMLGLFLGAMLVVPTPTTRVAAAPAALPPEQANWDLVNHDGNGTNYNPQTQINPSNVANLQVQWIFPYLGLESTVPGLKSVNFVPGSAAPPLVHNGIVYVMTNNMILYAISAKDGSMVWRYNYGSDLNYSDALKTLPIAPYGGHIHGINYINGTVYFTGLVCDINGVDALTGKQNFSIKNICTGTDGNRPEDKYRGYQQSHPPEIYFKGAGGHGIVVTAEAGAAPGLYSSARAFLTGYDRQTGQLLWRTYTIPPRNGSDASNFALQYCDRGWIQGVPCTKVVSDPAIKALFQKDWLSPIDGKMRFNSGTSGVWGFFPIDQKKGIVIMSTSQASPDGNGTLRPGPNLYAASFMALNATNGNVLWFFQSTTHDIWDYDCSWNGSLGHITVNGVGHDVYLKTCKNGYVYALDEMTGAPYWFGPAPGESRGPNPPIYGDTKPHNFEQLGDVSDPNTYTRGIASQKTVHDKPSPWTSNGGIGYIIESDHAIDGKNFYTVSVQHPSNITTACTDNKPGCNGSGVLQPDLPQLPHNATVSALDENTGKVVWTYLLKDQQFAGGVTATGGMLMVPANDGNLYAFNTQNGQVISQKNLGSAMNVQCSVGATSDGKEQIYLSIGGGNLIGKLSGGPGALIALGLPAGVATGSIATTTITSTVAGSGATTVTTTVPGQVTGFSPTVTYATAAIAIIAVIAAIALAVRGRGK